MSMNLNIPITQTITLPDSWQACKTPQELSYWIIAKFDNFTTQFTEINNAMLSLQSMIETNTDDIATNDIEITEIKNTLSIINSDIETLQTDYNTLNEDLTTLYGLHQTLSNKVATIEDAVTNLNVKTITRFNDSNNAVNLTNADCGKVIILRSSDTSARPKIVLDESIETGFFCDIYWYSTDSTHTFSSPSSLPLMQTDFYNNLESNGLYNGVATGPSLSSVVNDATKIGIRIIMLKDRPSDGLGSYISWQLLS